MLRSLVRIAAAALIAAGIGGTAGAADLQDILSAGKIRIGVPIDVAPFGFMDADNKPAGLDVDVANMVAAALGVEVELQQITGANRIPYLVSDRLDLVIATLGLTPERAQQIAYSSPYSALVLGVFGPDSIAVSSPADLGSISIAVTRGTTQDLELTAKAPGANIIRFDDDATSAAAFLSGQAQLFATANVVAESLMKKDPNVQLKTKFVLRHQPVHIGLQQGNPNLLRWVDSFVFFNMSNGKLSELAQKWVGQPLPANFPTL